MRVEPLHPLERARVEELDQDQESTFTLRSSVSSCCDPVGQARSSWIFWKEYFATTLAGSQCDETQQGSLVTGLSIDISVGGSRYHASPNREAKKILSFCQS